MNAEPTRFDEVADVVIPRAIGEVLPAITARITFAINAIHGIPNRSTTMPKRAAQNVGSSGSVTLPSLRQLAENPFGVAGTRDLESRGEAFGLAHRGLARRRRPSTPARRPSRLPCITLSCQSARLIRHRATRAYRKSDPTWAAEASRIKRERVIAIAPEA